MAHTGSGKAKVPAGTFLARLSTGLGVSDTLTLLPYNGNKVEVNRRLVNIPDAGLTLDVADNLIDASGADSGSPGVASTPYQVYISNALASFSPSSIRLSVATPTLVGGVKYLGNSGDAPNWRFVGLVYLNATPQFESTPQNQLICNYYNRLRVKIFSPASGDFSTTSGSYVQVDPAGSLTVSFLSNGEDSIRLAGAGAASESAICLFAAGIGIDSTTAPSIVAVNGRGGVGIQETIAPQMEVDLSEGFHFATLLYVVSGGTTLAFSALDPVGSSGVPATFMDGSLFV
jgi:hypothetical protein